MGGAQAWKVLWDYHTKIENMLNRYSKGESQLLNPILEEIEETRARSNRALGILGILPTMFNRSFSQDQEAMAALATIARAASASF